MNAPISTQALVKKTLLTAAIMVSASAIFVGSVSSIAVYAARRAVSGPNDDGARDESSGATAKPSSTSTTKTTTALRRGPTT